MAKFIPIDKMKKLREASRNGDENAKKILAMQLGGTEDFSSLMDDYFKSQPQVEEAPTGATSTQGYGLKEATADHGLEKFLSFNNITKDSPDYQSYVDDYYKENPRPEMKVEEHCFIDDLIKDEIEAISGYGQAELEVMQKEDMEETTKKGVLIKLDEIKRDEMKHLEELRRLKASIHKKAEKEEIL